MNQEMTGAATTPEATAVLADFQADYLNAMIAGSGRQADQVITHAFDQQVVVNDVYLNILQTTAYEIGRLWQVNKFTVAQEHL
ncbi:MAG: B12-binding domain-containing protein, partial [Anaerolineae bacterium]